MMRSLVVTLAVLVMMAGLTLPTRADTTFVSGTLTGNSVNTPTSNPDVFIDSFTGSGVDSLSGAYTTTSTKDLVFTSLTTFDLLSAPFEDVFSGGTVFGTSSGFGFVTPTGATVSVTFNLITGGTGIFAGDTGETTVTGTGMPTGPTTSSFTGDYTGFVRTMPEPSSLALLLAGIGLLLVVRKF